MSNPSKSSFYGWAGDKLPIYYDFDCLISYEVAPKREIWQKINSWLSVISLQISWSHDFYRHHVDSWLKMFYVHLQMLQLVRIYIFQSRGLSIHQSLEETFPHLPYHKLNRMLACFIHSVLCLKICRLIILEVVAFRTKCFPNFSAITPVATIKTEQTGWKWAEYK